MTGDSGRQDAMLLSRRGLIAAGASAAIVASGGVHAQGAGTIVMTRSGRVRGRAVGDVTQFLGIPYGATTQSRRFMPALPARPWKGVLDALDFGPQSPQASLGVFGESQGPLRDWTNPRPSSEDCLNLNVFAPQGAPRDGRRGRPVMVWLHGGGFTIGSSARRYADGTRLAGRQDVVVVSLNHRLNAFGYLYLAHLAPDLADSGNIGNLDMVLALKWVRDNISRFGGDPGNVTIFGESGGGGKVACLRAMPAAAGLFHKAIQQSGSGLRERTKEEAISDTAKFLSALNLAPSEIGRLRTMPFADIEAVLERAGASMRPVVDGRVLPAQPNDPVAPAISRKVPLMIGCNKDEAALRVALGDQRLYAMTWEELPVRLNSEISDMDAARVVAGLRELYPQARPIDIYITASSWAWMRADTILVAERAVARGGAPVFMYLLAWQSPMMEGRLKSPHAIDLPFVFDLVENSRPFIGTGPEQDRLAAEMSSAWARFARTGSPGWPAYAPPERATMVFDAESRVVSDPHSAERQLFVRKDGYRGSCC